MNTKLITAPAVEPISTSDAKTHLRISSSSEDTYIGTLISAARRVIEQYTKRVLITQTWNMYLDQFPGYDVYNGENWWDGPKDGSISMLYGSKRHIDLPYPPIQSVTYVKGYDDTDTATTLDASAYYVDTSGIPGRVVLRNGQTWPTILLRPGNGVEVQFVAGYGDASTDVPEAIIQSMLLIIGHLYENRGDQPLKMNAMMTGSIPSSALALLSPYIFRRI